MRTIIIFLFICPFMLMGQTASLTGIVSIGQESAVGAHLKLLESDHEMVTDIDGRYLISNVPFGPYTLQVTFIGAQDFSIDIDITGDLTIDIPLENSTNIVDEVTIVAKSESRAVAERAIEIESVSIKEVSSRVKDIGEVLTRLPGVNVRGSGSFGDRVDISLNGLNGTAVRSFIDGMPLEFLSPQLSISNIPVDNIKRVDVYKGVVPVDVGTDALGGGINLVTLDKHYNELKVVAGYGSFNTISTSLLGSYSISDHLTISGAANYNHSDNDYSMTAYIWEERSEGRVKRFHDAYDFSNAEVALSVKEVPWADRLKLSFNYADYEKELQHGGQLRNTAFGAVKAGGESKVYRLIYEKSLNKKLRFSNQVAYSDIRATFIDTTANVYSWSGEIIARQPSNAGEFSNASNSIRNFSNIANRTSVHYDLSEDDRLTLSNIYAHQSTEGRDIVRDEERDFLKLKQTLLKNVLGLQYERELLSDRFILALGAKYYTFKVDGFERLSRAPISQSKNETGYYVTSKLNITDDLFIRASYESALRIPLFYQYFGDGIKILSNIELQSETSNNINVGINWSKRFSPSYRLRIEANGFYRGQNDIIYLTNEFFQQYRNAEEVNSRGVEIDIHLQFLKNFLLIANATKLQKTYGDIDDKNIAAQFLEGTSFPNTPDFFVNAMLSYAFDDLLPVGHRLSLYGRYRHIDEFNFVNESKVYNPDSYVPVQVVIDAGINYKWLSKGLDLSLNANNILDAEVYDNFSIPKPGRNFNIKLAYTINNLNK